ncbi:MAG: glycosyltransferase family 4 protein [Solirubrobacteraceae bacterium]
MDPAPAPGGRADGLGLSTRAPHDHLGPPAGGRESPIVLNGRAATRPTITGVERWTAEVLGRLPALAPGRYVVAVPRPRIRRRAPAQAWEQVALPARAARLRAALVFSPANLAPLCWPRNVVVLHDAAVLREPDAYSSAYRAWHRHVGLACARRALAVVTVSEFSRRELVELAGLDPARLMVIGGGVDGRFGPDGDPARDAASRRALGLSSPYVLTIATADQRKNLGALQRSAAQLAQLGIELVWAGDSRPYFARDRHVTGVRSLGYIADVDLPAVYRGARAFVLPSRYEGFGLTCVEAMASGIPVVAADRAALPETCGDAALLVDPGDGDAFAAAVVAAATEDDLRGRLRAAGLKRARALSWDGVAARTHELLSDLAEAPTSR